MAVAGAWVASESGSASGPASIRPAAADSVC